jgi:hypothetical protein
MTRPTGTVYGMAGGDYCQLYIPAAVTQSRRWPFAPGDDVSVSIVERAGAVILAAPDQELVDADLDLRGVES